MTKQLLILLFTFAIFSCGKTRGTVYKCPKGYVSVTVINKNTKPISSLSLITHGTPKDSIEEGDLAMNDKKLICFDSGTESSYYILVVFNDGDSVKSKGVYVEGGYATTETVYNDSIVSKYNDLY